MIIAKGTDVLRTTDPSGASFPDINRYCFTGHSPAIRVETRITTMITFNSVAQFQGKYLAQAMRLIETNGDNTDIALDVVELITTPNDADFAPPAENTLAPAIMTLPEATDLTAATRIGGEIPRYPSIALAARMQGIVVMQEHLLKDGTVADVKVISGPPMLQSAAVAAVKTWHYRPNLMDGQPVEVESRVITTFSLGH
jgi:TonB family protein